MTALAVTLFLLPVLVFGYAYVVYPAILWIATRDRPRFAAPEGEPAQWPTVTITVPVYNEERSIRQKLEELLQLDYPADRRQILVISDASTDRTDEIVREFADRRVELLRLERRSGKSAAENAAGAAARGEIIVNNDATIGIPPHALKALVRAFEDPTVGVASGRDVSVGDVRVEQSAGEHGYVGYEMWVRGLETRIGSIVGASGCFYGIRARIYDSNFPPELSRDFASALIARKHGFRAVSVEEAMCFVPRTTSLKAEYRRKIRTMARGLETLWRWRAFLDPLRYGSFAWMLLSHKLARWLFYLVLPLSLFGLVLLSIQWPIAMVLLALTVIVGVLGAIGMNWPADRRAPRVIAMPGFVVAANLAGVRAWIKLMKREQNALWEPTRRPA